MKNILVAALVVALPALAADPAAKQAAAGMKPLEIDEKGLVERLHDDNQREIMLGKLAQQKATNQATKDFASMMIREHEQADKDVMALASKLKVTPGKPKAQNDAERKMMAHTDATVALLQAKEGPMFDSIYMSNMVADHDHAVFLTTRAMDKFAANAELAGFLKQLQPKLIQHREHAYKALGAVRVDQNMGIGGAGQGGAVDHKGH